MSCIITMYNSRFIIEYFVFFNGGILLFVVVYTSLTLINFAVSIYWMVLQWICSLLLFSIAISLWLDKSPLDFVNRRIRMISLSLFYGTILSAIITTLAFAFVGDLDRFSEYLAIYPLAICPSLVSFFITSSRIYSDVKIDKHGIVDLNAEWWPHHYDHYKHVT